MSNGTASLSGSFRYIPPGGGQASEQVGYSAPYNDSAVGILDVADTTPAATLFPIPVGGITKIKSFYIDNQSGQDLGVRFNAAGADEFQIPSGSAMTLVCPADPAANPLTEITLTTTATQVGDGKINYRVFGD